MSFWTRMLMAGACAWIGWEMLQNGGNDFVAIVLMGGALGFLGGGGGRLCFCGRDKPCPLH
jgi:hypothetical protein